MTEKIEIEEKRRWLYKKLKEYRSIDSLNERLDILEEIVKQGYKKDLYLKRLARILVENQRYSEAIKILDDIRNKDIITLSLMVRSLSYLGRYEEAKKCLDKVLGMLELNYDLPYVLSQVSFYYFLRGETREGLALLNSYIEDIINIPSSKRYLANFYNRLAILNYVDGNIENALHFYNLASDYAKRSNDKLILYRIMNNAGDVGRYLYGPKSSIKYNLEAYEMAKDFPKDFIVVSLSNLINAKAQFCSSNEIEAMLKELEEMLKDVNIEYFLYIGYRRLALVNIYYHRSEEIRRFIPYLRNIKSIPENNVLIKIFEGYLGEDIDLLSLEEDVLETKEIQIILIYLRLLLEKGLTPRKITKEFYSEFPLYQFMKGLIEKEDPISLLKYIDSMLERWEYLDALSSYLLLIKTAGLQDHSLLQYLSYFEAMSVSHLLNLNSIAEKLRKEIPLNGFPVDEYARVRIIEYYFKEALINSENEEQAIRLIYRVLSEYLDDFLIRVDVASRTIEKGNTLFGTGNEKLRYENSPFSITLYSREEPNSLTLSLLRSFLNAFIIFWERRYGMYDALTGLLNRAYGIKRIEESFNEYKRNKEPFSIVFIDVDSLKKINDTMGHSYGDLVLQEIASSIKSTIRQTDYAIRWGGDEFLILLRNTDYDNAEKVIKRIDDRISASSDGRFSVSYGVEAVSEYTTTYNKLIETADIKMYANKYSKRRGGNISES